MKTLKCADVRFQCEHVVEGKTIEEVMQKAAEHARTVHHVEVTPEQAVEIAKLVKDGEKKA
jgi:predicted small metal-binding protein